MVGLERTAKSRATVLIYVAPPAPQGCAGGAHLLKKNPDPVLAALVEPSRPTDVDWHSVMADMGMASGRFAWLEVSMS